MPALPAVIRRGPFALHDAQSAIAREYGFRSWAALRAHVSAVLEAQKSPEEEVGGGSVSDAPSAAESGSTSGVQAAAAGEAPSAAQPPAASASAGGGATPAVVDEYVLIRTASGKPLPAELESDVRAALKRRGMAHTYHLVGMYGAGGHVTAPRPPAAPAWAARAAGAAFGCPSSKVAPCRDCGATSRARPRQSQCGNIRAAREGASVSKALNEATSRSRAHAAVTAVTLGALATLAVCAGCGASVEPEALDEALAAQLQLQASPDAEAEMAVEAEGGRPGLPTVEYIGCDEFAGVGVVPSETVAERVPADFTLLEPEPGLALLVAQGARCSEIRVAGGPSRPGVFAQLGVGVIPPLGTGDGNFYQLMFSSTHPGVVSVLRAAGANAVFSRRLSYTIESSAGPDADLELRVPRPEGLAWQLEGPITLPDPASDPAPLTTFNYWHQSERAGNVLQANAVTNIRLGSGAGVTLTALGDELEAIIGCGPFSFPFFSNPETFDRAELTITRGAF